MEIVLDVLTLGVMFIKFAFSSPLAFGMILGGISLVGICAKEMAEQ